MIRTIILSVVFWWALQAAVLVGVKFLLGWGGRPKGAELDRLYGSRLPGESDRAYRNRVTFTLLSEEA